MEISPQTQQIYDEIVRNKSQRSAWYIQNNEERQGEVSAPKFFSYFAVLLLILLCD